MRPDQRHEVASVGGFFALRTGEPDGGTPLAGIYGGDGAPLTLRVDLVATRLGARERRVAASIAHLGLAARLWSVALGSAALHGLVPVLDPERLYWTPDRSSPDDLVLTEVRSRPASVAAIRDVVQRDHLVPLATALRRDTRISPRLLWGNAGSALAGAVRELDTWAGARGRPEVVERARALAAGLFAHPDLAGTVRGPAMRRTSCCLYYRAGGGLCGDCTFDAPPTAGARG
ncbi:IucA/IucC family C-terminal-domain containing protein [Streptomyces sp. NPDC048057]|uniref:IucA/IucC family C-terminal-domain containing protein n=1 Tax=Streptomyces sp. NPDC048057 TaxID=3155628 RepID=UPI0033C82B5C